MDGYKEILVYEKIPYKLLRVFRVWTPQVCTKGFYREVTSRTTFYERELKRVFQTSRPKDEIFYEVHHDPRDYDMHQSGWERTCVSCNRKVPERSNDPAFMRYEDKLFPVTEIVGWFNFYTEIGYDYKKQKYLPESPYAKYLESLK